MSLTFTGGKRTDHSGSFYIKSEQYYDNNVNNNRATLMQPKFTDCVFKDNQVINTSYGGYGGAFWIENAAPIFESCVLEYIEKSKKKLILNEIKRVSGGLFFEVRINPTIIANILDYIPYFDSLVENGLN